MTFRDALSGGALGVIAEFKRRSPSAGDIRPGADAAAYARADEAGSAHARARASTLRSGRGSCPGIVASTSSGAYLAFRPDFVPRKRRS